MSLPFDPPIYINVRDRVTVLRKLIAWLEKAGHERIILLDNDSTFEPLFDVYETTPHEVVRFGENLGSRSIWDAGLAPDEPYVFTDPDIVPIEDCPLDAVQQFKYLLDRGLGPKVGFGLYMDDLPADFRFRAWEAGPQIQGPYVAPGTRRSLIDTTFALYHPSVKAHRYEGIRTTYPYQARHLSPSWYGGEPSPEERYYLDHIPGPLRGAKGSSWAQVVPAP